LVAAIMMLTASFIAAPAPEGPRWSCRAVSAASTGRARSKAAAGPPTMVVSVIDVHMLISAYCFFRVSNRHTFGAIFGLDMLDPARATATAS
jgi:hypothetical protein